MDRTRPLSREPLLHFFAIGALLFAVDLWRSPPSAEDNRTITVPEDVIASMGESLTRRTGSPPTDAERDLLIADYVQEEVLYREALDLGFERGDLIIRRRLVQKMEFLLEDLSPVPEPTDGVLQSWLDRHPEDYEQPARYELDHVYFSRDRHGEQTVAVAQQALRGLTPGVSAAEAARSGDPSMIPAHQSLRAISRVARDFGGDFARGIVDLEPGDWRGPVTSSYGEHLVRINERHDARPASLDEVRDAVRRDYETAERHARRQQTLELWVDRYQVEVNLP